MKIWTLSATDAFATDFVLVDEDGNKMEGVMSADISMAKNEVTRITIELVPGAATVKGVIDGVYFCCPNCGDSVNHQCESQTLGRT